MFSIRPIPKLLGLFVGEGLIRLTSLDFLPILKARGFEEFGIHSEEIAEEHSEVTE